MLTIGFTQVTNSGLVGESPVFEPSNNPDLLPTQTVVDVIGLTCRS